MGAIFGLIGDASPDEVRAMGEQMPHRGAGIRVWSPAARVYFGTRGVGGRDAHGCLAADAQLDELSCAELESVLDGDLDALKAVHGYFSIAYWDSARERVVLMCDTSGFKSLYYAALDGRIAFCSEYKALLALRDFRPRLNRDAAQYYLATRSFRMEQPLMCGVHPLTAGRALIVRPAETRRHSYWRPIRRLEHRSPEDWARAVRETLLRVVERQTRRFSRVGVTLSGGLDSACVLALLRAARPQLEIASYTIGFGPSDPDVRGGRELAALFGTRHRELSFEPDSVPRHLPKLVWLMEDCTGREEALLQYQLLSVAAKSEKVIFGGYGSDLLFGGMPRHRLVRLRELLPWLHVPLAEVFQLTQTGIAPSTWIGRLGQRVLYGSHAYQPPVVNGARASVRVRDDVTLDEFIADQMCEAQDSGYLEATLESAGVEFRDPFQATDIMDLALRIPGACNVGLWRQKKILRRAVAKLLPRSIVGRRKSLQRVPHDLRLSEVLDEIAETLLSPASVRDRGLMEPEYVRRLRDRRSTEAYSSDRLYRLWTLLCLESWQRQFVDRRELQSARRSSYSALAPVAQG